MAQTKLNNLVNPEVMGPGISAALPKKIKFSGIAKIDTTLTGQAGNTVTVPKFQYIGDAEDVAEGVAMGTTVLAATTTKATVKKAGKALELTDEAVLSGYGDPVGEAEHQLAMSVAAKVDNDCYDALKTATLTHDGSVEIISYDGVVDAIDKFQEEDQEARILFIHPSQATQLRKDPNFKDINKYPLQTIMTGVIGEIAGCQVVTTKKITATESAYENVIAKNGALTIYLKKDIEIETARDILAKTTVISVDEHYVVVLSDDSKALKVTFKK